MRYVSSQMRSGRENHTHNAHFTNAGLFWTLHLNISNTQIVAILLYFLSFFLTNLAYNFTIEYLFSVQSRVSKDRTQGDRR